MSSPGLEARILDPEPAGTSPPCHAAPMRSLIFVLAIATAAREHGDPRRLPACREAFGRFARDPARVRTVEDAIANRTAPLPARALHARMGACAMRYGRLVNASDGGGAVFYVEVPKAASTTMKAWLRPTLVPRHSRPFDGAPPQRSRSFVVVSSHTRPGWSRHRGPRYRPHASRHVSAPPPSDPTT